jgi:hypothetical protein
MMRKVDLSGGQRKSIRGKWPPPDSCSIHLKARLREYVKEVQAVVSRPKSQAAIVYWQEM